MSANASLKLKEQKLSGQKVRIAIAGNPNCGKTTLFNALTGLRYKVANYPGVTVERKRGNLNLTNFTNAIISDLPGTYSLSGTSEDEVIATSVLLGEIKDEPVPDCIIAVIDAANLERNLYLVSQLIDFGIPMVIALNMIDLAESRGVQVHSELLSRALDVPVIPIVASKSQGLTQLREAVDSLLRSGHVSSKRFGWLGNDSPYRTEAEQLGKLYLEKHHSSEHAGAIFAGSNLLSDSFKADSPDLSIRVSTARVKLTESKIDSFSFEPTNRYGWINKIVKTCSSIDPQAKSQFADKMDSLFTHRIWGCLIFVSVMALIFQSIFLWAQLPMDFIESGVSLAGDWLNHFLPEGQLRSLIVDGILAGVGNVLVFVPQIALLFFFLGLLEDSGYLSRAAFVMDRVMRPFGLQGRSFIPLLSSFACAIPGIMSSRTIPSRSDRLATIMIAPLMSCSARLPVYAVLIAACIPPLVVGGIFSLQGLTMLGMYLLGVVGAAFVALILKHTVLKGEPAILVMEMPPIRMPSIKVVLREVFDRALTFVKSAGTVILACSIVLWVLGSYPKLPENTPGSELEYSYAGRIGKSMEPVLSPIGLNWQMGVGILASFAAREVFVSALATVYNLESSDDASESLIEILKRKNVEGSFTTLSAISLMVFYVFACQCMSTLAVCRRETGSWGWTVFMFVYMTALAYAASLVVYQGGIHIYG